MELNGSTYLSKAGRAFATVEAATGNPKFEVRVQLSRASLTLLLIESAKKLGKVSSSMLT